MKTLPNILAIDPSIRACGWAGYNPHSNTICAGTVKSKKWRVEFAVRSICEKIWQAPIKHAGVIIIEKPKMYENWSENKKRGVETLLICYGALVNDFYEPDVDTVLWTPTVQEWKGQIPKVVCHKRAFTALDKAGIQYDVTGLDHNAKDAIALIVAYLQKERFI